MIARDARTIGREFEQDAVNRGGGFEGGEYLDGDVHGPAADEPVVPSEILIEPKAEEAALVFGHESLGAGADLGFDAAAAEGADGVAIAQDQHGRAFALGRAAAGANHRAQGDNLTEFGSADDLREEINHNKNPAR